VAEAIRTPEQAAPTPVPEPSAVEAPVTSAPAVPSPEPTSPVEERGGLSWLWLLLALGLGAGAFLVVRMRRREAPAAGDAPLLLTEAEPAPPRAEPRPVPAPRPAAAPAPAPAPTPAPAAAPAGSVGIVMRPWLEIDFRPERAVAAETGAEVRYEVTLRNTGNAPARNVRLAARMFSAGPQLDQEIAAFFARGVDGAGAAPLTILPRSDVTFQSVVNLPRDQVREIRMEGRSLFVPTVAFNLLYDYGRDKTGQTCSSHVVGREAETPTAKMGPFRLDLGPRVWRSVGQRPSALARAV
jgi:hypothetical protein